MVCCMFSRGKGSAGILFTCIRNENFPGMMTAINLENDGFNDKYQNFSTSQGKIERKVWINDIKLKLRQQRTPSRNSRGIQTIQPCAKDYTGLNIPDKAV